MQKKSRKSDDAVSPVVGVMLMLVVTIIIAAVVAAFAGGLADSTTPAPQAIFSADLKYSDSMILYHKGGDAISGSAIDVILTVKSGSYIDMVYPVNLTAATLATSGSPLLYGVIQPGETITGISWDDHIFTAVSQYGRMEPAIGDLVEVSIIDATSGKPISTSTIAIQ